MPARSILEQALNARKGQMLSPEDRLAFQSMSVTDVAAAGYEILREKGRYTNGSPNGYAPNTLHTIYSGLNEMNPAALPSLGIDISTFSFGPFKDRDLGVFSPGTQYKTLPRKVLERNVFTKTRFAHQLYGRDRTDPHGVTFYVGQLGTDFDILGSAEVIRPRYLKSCYRGIGESFLQTIRAVRAAGGEATICMNDGDDIAPNAIQLLKASARVFSREGLQGLDAQQRFIVIDRMAISQDWRETFEQAARAQLSPYTPQELSRKVGIEKLSERRADAMMKEKKPSYLEGVSIDEALKTTIVKRSPRVAFIRRRIFTGDRIISREPQMHREARFTVMTGYIALADMYKAQLRLISNTQPEMTLGENDSLVVGGALMAA
ncbi:MAG: hypothetical protein HY362_00230 [Candidatus Aenigmarchaeota archaeon]|nr:hypothetical protein [Candidatus Aenigmarchaeota archaeon]